MKIKLLVSRAGTGFAQSVGEIIDVSADEGARMIQAEQAIPVTGASPQNTIRKSVKRESRKK